MNAQAQKQIPTLGRVLLYMLTAKDADEINRRRTSGPAIRQGIERGQWPLGAQAHIGNTAAEGQVFPADVVRVRPGGVVNLQVKLDGTDTLWVQGPQQADVTGPLEPGTWQWPQLVPA